MTGVDNAGELGVPGPVSERATATPATIVALSAAAFVSAFGMRVADPLIPQIAADLGTSVGQAALVTTGFALAYGLGQLVWGPLGDRHGKFRVVTWTVTFSVLLAALPALAGGAAMLGLTRAMAGAVAAAGIPLSMAFIGDHVPYTERQAAIARFLTGQILGVIGGQAIGGLLGDRLHWRAVFVLVAALYALVALWLWRALRRGGLPAPVLAPARGPKRQAAAYLELLRRPWVRTILVVVGLEGVLFYGSLAFTGAFAHARLGLAFGPIGLALAVFGLGGLVYAGAVRWLVRRLGEAGLARAGGLLLGLGTVVLVSGLSPLVLPAAMLLQGLGFYMLHNTLQTHATQMAPEARGAAVSLFAAALFFGQAIGVTLLGLAIAQVGWSLPLLVAGAALALLGLAFGHRLVRRAALSAGPASS